MTQSQLQLEIAEAPAVVTRQLTANAPAMTALCTRLRERPPPFVATSARGSSSHAATFAKYLIEGHLGLVTAPLAPSITSIYRQRVNLDGALFITISQSGSSPDLVEQAAAAGAGGALTVAVVNHPDSPLAKSCDVVLPLQAGVESSVAATKSFIASLTAVAHLVATWSGDQALAAALPQLADRLHHVPALDWSPVEDALAGAASMYTIGRGPGLAVAREAALKLKEVCAIHAEPHSAAEIMHGPVTLVGPGYPILAFAPPDAAHASVTQLAADLVAKGAVVLTASQDPAAPGIRLPTVPALHPALDAVPMLQSFYGCLIGLARRRGIDADHPRHLQKVTRTT